MRLLILNRRKLGVTVIIIGLMVVLFAAERQLESRLKFTALMQSNITELKSYKALDNKFTYKLPSEWRTSEQNFGGDEIIYHNDFQSRDAVTHGFVEVWNIKDDLRNFLEKSMQLSQYNVKYKNYNLQPIKVNNREGYLLTYNMITANDVSYNGHEYFIRDDGKYIRFSFFVRSENFKENMPTIYKAIVETYRYNPNN